MSPWIGIFDVARTNAPGLSRVRQGVHRGRGTHCVAPCNRASGGVVLVRPLSRVPLIGRTPAQAIAHPDPLDHQHPVLHLDVAFGVRLQLPLPGVDPARLQRATQGAGQSAGGGGNHVVERGGPGLNPLRQPAVVLADGAVGAKRNRLGLGRKVREPIRPPARGRRGPLRRTSAPASPCSCADRARACVRQSRGFHFQRS